MTTITNDQVVTKIKTNSDAMKALNASGAELTDNNELLITDPKKNLTARIDVIQRLLASLKDRNNPNKEEQQANLEEAISQYIMVVSAAITNNIVESDDTGILSCDSKNKYFPKSTGHVNAIAKKILAQQAKVAAHEGSKLSETELAKLIETPYNYKPLVGDSLVDETVKEVDAMPEANGDSVVDIECVDGSTVRIDKTDATMYVSAQTESGFKVFARKMKWIGYTWFETAKNIAVAIFSFVWGLVKSFGIFGVSLVTGTIATIIGSSATLVSNVATTSTGLFSDLKNSYSKAKKTAEKKGIFFN